MLMVLILLLILLCIVLAVCIIEYDLLKISNKKLNNADHILFVLKKWDNRRKEEKDFLEKRLILENHMKIAVYGYGILGRRLIRELEGSQIERKYYIDRNALKIQADIPVFMDTEDLPEVDVIIVTVVSQFCEIKSMLNKKVKYLVVNIEDLL